VAQTTRLTLSCGVCDVTEEAQRARQNAVNGLPRYDEEIIH